MVKINRYGHMAYVGKYFKGVSLWQWFNMIALLNAEIEA